MRAVREWLRTFHSQVLIPACEGKAWSPRLLFWLFLCYVTVQQIRISDYQGIFAGLNLGIHEFGHLIASPFGWEFFTVLAGSLVQCLVPLISFFMFYRQRDFFAWSFSLVWLGNNLNGVATYIGDARKLELQLVTPFGGDEVIHDWNYLLHDLGVLQHEMEIAYAVRLLGIGAAIIGVIWGAWILWQMFQRRNVLPMPAGLDVG